MDETNENESLRQGLSCPGDDSKPELNSGPGEMNGLGSPLLQTSPNKGLKFNFFEDALSNTVVLRKIFTFLNEQDLLSCCHVCTIWRDVADPLVISYFEIRLSYLDQPSTAHLPINWITVSEWDRYSKRFSQYKSDFQGITERLEQVLLTHKVNIKNLWISKSIDMCDYNLMNFFSKIGPLVLELQLDNISELPMNVADFCKLLLHKFPNLKTLYCCHFRPHVDDVEDENFTIDLPQNKHKTLRTISFGYQSKCMPIIKAILKICQNLDEIEDFPVQMISAIVFTEKGQALKSFSHHGSEPDDFHDNGETVMTAYEKLAQLQPKLTSLEINPEEFADYDDDSFEMIKPFLFSVLRSSHESLEFLGIPPVRSDEVPQFPTLKGLKTLELYQCHPEDGTFFPPEMPVREIFPNVRKIISKFTWDEAFINHHLPENIISPWGTQINSLSIGHMEASCILAVQRLFPSLQQLRLNSRAEEVGISLIIFSQFWPQLKSLEFNSKEFADCDESSFEMIKPYLLAVLHSNDESLEFLGIPLEGSNEVPDFSTLKGLKTLELYQCHPEDRTFFPSEMLFAEIFPIVSKIVSKSTWDEAFINRYFPENAVSPWGTQINCLSIGRMDASCIPTVQRFFPSLQQLRLNNYTVEVGNSLLQLSRFMPQLKSLTICVDFFGFEEWHWCEKGGRPFRLDDALTGLSDKVIDQLEDPVRKKVFTEEEIQGFKDQSIIGKLKELKELKLYLGEHVLPLSYLRLTPVANEFGFKLLPELKVTLGIPKVEKIAEKIKTDLEPLALCSNIEIVDDYLISDAQADND